MTALPASSDFTGATVTEGNFKTAITAQRDYLAGLMATDGTVATALATLGVLASVYSAKTAAYTVVAADRGRYFDATSGTWTLTLPTVASSGNGFSFFIRNSGAGIITIDPAGAELIDGVATVAIDAGNCALVICTGTVWFSHKLAITTFRDNDFTILDNLDPTKSITFQVSGLATATSRVFSWPDIGGSTVVVDGGAQTISGNKTFTGDLTATDANLFIKDNADPTKILKFQLSGIAPATTRTITIPDANGTIAYLDSPVFTGTPRITPTTVAGLGAVTAGGRGFVTDSNATTAAGHGNIVAAGGANFCPVYADGTNWRIG